MRCHKCGFFSFDYLSECKKCGVSLTANREALGLSSLKPTEPFLLGALLKGGLDPALKAVSGGPAGDPGIGDPNELDLGGLDLHPGQESAGGAEGSRKPFPARAQMKDQLDAALRIFEDIEEPGRPASSPGAAARKAQDAPVAPFSNDDAAWGDNLDLELDSMLSDITPSAPAGKEAETGVLAREVGEAPVLELADEDLERLILEAELQEGGGAESAPAGRQAVETGGGAKTAAPSGKAEEDAEELVIELSDDDLKNLLLELEETGTEEAKEKKGAASPAGPSGGK